MDTRTAPALGELAGATPAGRNRAIDFYRVVAMIFVAVGHWLVIAIGTDGDGELFARNALEVVPRFGPVTWLFQVMPLFFAVGGFASAMSLDAHRRRQRRQGAGATAGDADWIIQRLRRLIAPTVVLAAVVARAARHRRNRRFRWTGRTGCDRGGHPALVPRQLHDRHRTRADDVHRPASEPHGHDERAVRILRRDRVPPRRGAGAVRRTPQLGARLVDVPDRSDSSGATMRCRPVGGCSPPRACCGHWRSPWWRSGRGPPR